MLDISTERTSTEEPAGLLSQEALIQLESDLDSEGRYGRRVIQVFADRVCILDAGEVMTTQIPVGAIETARNEPLAGGGRLEVTTKDGHVIPLISYTFSVAPRFSEAARGIEQLARGESLSINLKPERTRCAKCQRLLPEKDGICPACIRRGRTLMRVLGYMAPYRLQAIQLALLSLVTTVINLAPPAIQGSLIDHVLTKHRNLWQLWLLVGVWVGALAGGIMVQILSGRLIAFLGARISADLRSSLYRSIEFLQLSFFEKKQVGAITSRVTQDSDRVWGFLVEGLPFLVTNALVLVGVTVFLLTVNWRLTLFILAPLPMVAIISGLCWKRVSMLYHRFGQKWARFHMNLNEALSGIRVVKAFAQEDLEYAKFQKRNAELQEAGIRADTNWYTIFGVMSFFTSLGTVINWSVGGYMVYRGQMTLGDFWKVHAYLALVYGPMQWFAQVNNWFSRAMAGAERIFEVMDTEPEPYHAPGVAHPIEGEVTFQDVRFGYDKSNPVLKNLTFTAKPGEMVGLVGKSGAGKSTTINLICRFYRPDAGSILVDGIDSGEMQLQNLRRQIGMVLQEPFLFNGTIAENISYGKSDATFEEVVAAARAANAHQFILSKPDGYDNLVGERGSKLSGGERQRVSIARAILHNPRILILDEATSSVDLETERQIQEAIGRLIKGRTTFAIAHRLSTLRNADRLIVLEKGEIAEMGTHAELMEKQGVFYHLVQTQASINEIISAI